jgi:hypothetical protein
MTGNVDRDLLALLPDLYSVRDAETGGALRALLGVLGAQADVLDEDIGRLYDDWFIETCDERLAGHIGDLLGVRPLHSIGTGSLGPRAYVANTIAYRRRKGTAAVLEQLAQDVTGWPARAVEYFPLLATSEHLAHLRPGRPATASLRTAQGIELLGGPFEELSHTAEVREPRVGGRYGIRSVVIFLWRLAAFSVRRSTARPVTEPADGRYRAHPVGVDAPLFNPRRREGDITHLAGERDVPAPLRRRPLHEELEARRSGDPVPDGGWFGDPVFRLFLDPGTGSVEVPLAELAVCDLSDWRRPTRPGIAAAVDPVLGRIALPAGVVPQRVELSYSYGAGAQLGGGPYDRSGTLGGALDEATFVRAVSARAGDGGVVATVGEAVEAWSAQPAGGVGVIALLDSATCREDVAVDVPAGSVLFLVAARLPDGAPPRADRLLLTDARPHLLGDLTLRGVAGLEGAQSGRCVLSGLLVEGTVTGELLGGLRLSHSTVVPGGAVTVTASPGEVLELQVDSTVSASVSVTGEADLFLERSVVDGDVTAPDGDADIDSSTVLGAVTVRRLVGSDSLFTGTVHTDRRQDGCVRFSYVPPGSRTPRRHRCEPDLTGSPPPAFSAERYGDPGHARLDAGARALSTGASDGAEMGAFRHLRQPQRIQNLHAALDEYLPAGLSAGIVRVT